MGFFVEISLLLLSVSAISFVLLGLKQSLILGYILTGILLGPAGFNFIQSQDVIELLSQFGIVILLFIIGLHLSPKAIKEIGLRIIILGLIQVVLTSWLGWGLGLALGFAWQKAVFIGLALAFSSTIVILKILADQGDIQTLFGRVTVGFLIIQDVIVSVMLIFMGATNGSHLALTSLLLALVLKVSLLLAIVYLLSKILLPEFLHLAAASSELLFIFSLTWGVSVAALFYVFGLSLEIGALVAGVALATSEYAEEISSRLRPLRDFFIVLFFLLLGSQLNLVSMGKLWLPVVVFSLFVMLVKPLIVVVIMELVGFHKKTSFQVGVSLAQISEFSLIMAAMGLEMGLIDRDITTIITLVGIFSIALSTYLIPHINQIYPFWDDTLDWLQFRKIRNSSLRKPRKPEVVLFGFNRVGQFLFDKFKKFGLKSLVIDLDPASIEILDKLKIPYMYGDAGDVEFLNDLPINKAKLAISIIPDLETNLLLVKKIKAVNEAVIIIIFAKEKHEAEELYETGATLVIMPEQIGAKRVIYYLQRLGLNKQLYKHKRDQHLAELFR